MCRSISRYCECFRAGSLCVPGRCSCTGCKNAIGFEAERSAAMTKCLIKHRKRDTFGGGDGGPLVQRRESCSCRKSHCLMKYCECFEAKRRCGDDCKCLDCRNSYGRPKQKQARARSAKSAKAKSST